MSINIKTIQFADPTWDEYVYNHPKATLYHIFGWKNVIDKTYGHKTYYLMAIRESEGSQLKAQSSQLSVKNYELSLPRETKSLFNWGSNSHKLNPGQVVGILPLVHLKHFFFGNSLISIPFFDLGGILAGDEETEKHFYLKQ